MRCFKRVCVCGGFVKRKQFFVFESVFGERSFPFQEGERKSSNFFTLG